MDRLDHWLKLEFMLCPKGRRHALVGLVAMHEQLTLLKLRRLSLLLAHCKANQSFRTSFYDLRFARPIKLYHWKTLQIFANTTEAVSRLVRPQKGRVWMMNGLGKQLYGSLGLTPLMALDLMHHLPESPASKSYRFGRGLVGIVTAESVEDHDSEDSDWENEDDSSDDCIEQHCFQEHKTGAEYPVSKVYRAMYMWLIILGFLQNPLKLPSTLTASAAIMIEYYRDIAVAIARLAVVATASVVPDHVEGLGQLLPEGAGPRMDPKQGCRDLSAGAYKHWKTLFPLLVETVKHAAMSKSEFQVDAGGLMFLAVSRIVQARSQVTHTHAQSMLSYLLDEGVVQIGVLSRKKPDLMHGSHLANVVLAAIQDVEPSTFASRRTALYKMGVVKELTKLFADRSDTCLACMPPDYRRRHLDKLLALMEVLSLVLRDAQQVPLINVPEVYARVHKMLYREAGHLGVRNDGDDHHDHTHSVVPGSVRLVSEAWKMLFELAHPLEEASTKDVPSGWKETVPLDSSLMAFDNIHALLKIEDCWKAHDCYVAGFALLTIRTGVRIIDWYWQDYMHACAIYGTVGSHFRAEMEDADVFAMLCVTLRNTEADDPRAFKYYICPFNPLSHDRPAQHHEWPELPASTPPQLKVLFFLSAMYVFDGKDKHTLRATYDAKKRLRGWTSSFKQMCNYIAGMYSDDDRTLQKQIIPTALLFFKYASTFISMYGTELMQCQAALLHCFNLYFADCDYERHTEMLRVQPFNFMMDYFEAQCNQASLPALPDPEWEFASIQIGTAENCLLHLEEILAEGKKPTEDMCVASLHAILRAFRIFKLGFHHGFPLPRTAPEFYCKAPVAYWKIRSLSYAMQYFKHSELTKFDIQVGEFMTLYQKPADMDSHTLTACGVVMTECQDQSARMFTGFKMEDIPKELPSNFGMAVSVKLESECWNWPAFVEVRNELIKREWLERKQKKKQGKSGEADQELSTSAIKDAANAGKPFMVALHSRQQNEAQKAQAANANKPPAEPSSPKYMNAKADRAAFELLSMEAEEKKKEDETKSKALKQRNKKKLRKAKLAEAKNAEARTTTEEAENNDGGGEAESPTDAGTHALPEEVAVDSAELNSSPETEQPSWNNAAEADEDAGFEIEAETSEWQSTNKKVRQSRRPSAGPQQETMTTDDVTAAPETSPDDTAQAVEPSNLGLPRPPLAATGKRKASHSQAGRRVAVFTRDQDFTPLDGQALQEKPAQVSQGPKAPNTPELAEPGKTSGAEKPSLTPSPPEPSEKVPATSSAPAHNRDTTKLSSLLQRPTPAGLHRPSPADLPGRQRNLRAKAFKAPEPVKQSDPKPDLGPRLEQKEEKPTKFEQWLLSGTQKALQETPQPTIAKPGHEATEFAGAEKLNLQQKDSQDALSEEHKQQQPTIEQRAGQQEIIFGMPINETADESDAHATLSTGLRSLSLAAEAVGHPQARQIEQAPQDLHTDLHRQRTAADEVANKHLGMPSSQVHCPSPADLDARRIAEEITATDARSVSEQRQEVTSLQEVSSQQKPEKQDRRSSNEQAIPKPMQIPDNMLEDLLPRTAAQPDASARTISDGADTGDNSEVTASLSGGVRAAKPSKPLTSRSESGLHPSSLIDRPLSGRGTLAVNPVGPLVEQETSLKQSNAVGKAKSGVHRPSPAELPPSAATVPASEQKSLRMWNNAIRDAHMPPPARPATSSLPPPGLMLRPRPMEPAIARPHRALMRPAGFLAPIPRPDLPRPAFVQRAAERPLTNEFAPPPGLLGRDGKEDGVERPPGLIGRLSEHLEPGPHHSYPSPRSPMQAWRGPQHPRPRPVNSYPLARPDRAFEGSDRFRGGRPNAFQFAGQERPPPAYGKENRMHGGDGEFHSWRDSDEFMEPNRVGRHPQASGPQEFGRPEKPQYHQRRMPNPRMPQAHPRPLPPPHQPPGLHGQPGSTQRPRPELGAWPDSNWAEQ